jgi:hypothetical protein
LVFDLKPFCNVGIFLGKFFSLRVWQNENHLNFVCTIFVAALHELSKRINFCTSWQFNYMINLRFLSDV